MTIKETDKEFTIHHCGPKKLCNDGKEHDYSEYEDFDDGGTVVCSKCGHRAIDDAVWYYVTSIDGWKYLLHKPFSIRALLCRLGGHKCGVIWYNVGGSEPDMHCSNCGDDLS